MAACQLKDHPTLALLALETLLKLVEMTEQQQHSGDHSAPPLVPLPPPPAVAAAAAAALPVSGRAILTSKVVDSMVLTRDFVKV